MLLKFETARGGSNLDPAVGVFDLGVVVDLDSIPPDSGPGILDFFVSLPFRILDNEVKGMPLPVRSPGIAVGHSVHAEGRDPMSTDFPIVRILNVFSLW